MNLLNDQLEAVDFVFDIVHENRGLTTSFINELHALVTRHQLTVPGVDDFGKIVGNPFATRGLQTKRK